MRKSLKLALGLALVCAVASSDALAKSKQRAPVATGQVTATQGDDFPIPLPHNLTTGKDWLDDGSAPDGGARKSAAQSLRQRQLLPGAAGFLAARSAALQ